MNIVRSRPLGQFPGEGIASDITLGPQDTSGTDNFPMYYDPALLLAEQGATTAAPTPSVPVPPTSTSPIYATFGPIGTLDPTAVSAPPAPGAISPAPRVNVPSQSMFSSLADSLQTKTLAGLPIGAWIALGMLGLVSVAPGGKGRRR